MKTFVFGCEQKLDTIACDAWRKAVRGVYEICDESSSIQCIIETFDLCFALAYCLDPRVVVMKVRGYGKQASGRD